MHRRRKRFHFGGAERNIHCDAVISAACMNLLMNINKVLRVKYWGCPGPSAPPVPTPMICTCFVAAGIFDVYKAHTIFLRLDALLFNKVCWYEYLIK